mmetsp:Transcript_18579/g.44676  ORF Transcript_18579/g.44676 Transcript_18579/m.44676 type:complete len:122 (-) Transcript_18579:1737-2102(-)
MTETTKINPTLPSTRKTRTAAVPTAIPTISFVDQPRRIPWEGEGMEDNAGACGSQQQGDGIGSSFQSSARSEQSLRDADSFGSFNSKDHQLHSFKPHHRIGIGGRSEHGACLRQSTSGGGS